MTEKFKNYDAILVDTSVFDGNGLRLEKGLLGKLKQFKKTPVEYLFPDVIRSEVKKHLEEKIQVSRVALEKALNDAGDHLFFEGSDLNDAKKTLIDGKEIDGLAESRVTKFIDSTGALVLETGKYVSVAELLVQYFSNTPPFADSGKKKSEFPDAIVLLAVQSWAAEKGVNVLAVAKDRDWKKYCDSSVRIDYEEELSNALNIFNRTNAPYALVDALEAALEGGSADAFLLGLQSHLESAFDGYTPDQDADSHLYLEADGCHAWFKDFDLVENSSKVIDKGDGWVVLEMLANIRVDAEGEFSLSMYDSIDKDHVYMGSVAVQKSEEFESEILITLFGNFQGPINELVIDSVEVVSPIKCIHFGTIEPDYDDYY